MRAAARSNGSVPTQPLLVEPLHDPALEVEVEAAEEEEKAEDEVRAEEDALLHCRVRQKQQ